VAVQAVITFVLTCIGVMLATWGAPVLSGGDPRFFIAFMFIAVILIVMNFVADLLYSVLDPRVSHG
jgi:ABC-type microcin C transport system permease subunit YejB